MNPFVPRSPRRAVADERPELRAAADHPVEGRSGRAAPTLRALPSEEEAPLPRLRAEGRLSVASELSSASPRPSPVAFLGLAFRLVVVAFALIGVHDVLHRFGLTVLGY